MDQHLEWMTTTSRTIENAYDVLCSYEKDYNGKLDPDEQLHIMELLETINDIHKATQSMRTITDELKVKEQNITTQMTLLKNAMEMLELEAKTKSVKL